MIHVIVGTTHIRAILGYRRGDLVNEQIERVLDPLRAVPVWSVASAADLAGKTVYEALKTFHDRLSARLREEPADLLRARQEEIERVARDEYYQSEFVVTQADAAHSLAIHGAFPHGSIPGHPDPIPANLPDLSVGARCFGYFGTSPATVLDRLRASEIEECVAFFRGLGDDADEALVQEAVDRLTALRGALSPGFASSDLLDSIERIFARPRFARLSALAPLLEDCLERIRCFARERCEEAIESLWGKHHGADLVDIEGHLCDTLHTVYQRADAFWNELGKERADSGRPFDLLLARGLDDLRAGDEYLVIDATAHGFAGHRSLRRDNAEVPAVGTHRLLAGRALRQGIAKPFISGVFPIKGWRDLVLPTQHFLLDAAEKAGEIGCPPLYPNMPSPAEMRHLTFAAQRAEGDCGFDADEHAPSLRRLGIEGAVRRRIEHYLERLDQGEWAWDWTHAIGEYQAALYEGDIEQSLRLQATLDLYPLHKRILSMIETVLAPKLKERSRRDAIELNRGQVASLWANAFTGWDKVERRGAPATHRKGFMATDLPANRDDWAGMEVHGNWLVQAQQSLTSGAVGPLDLTDVLDGLVASIQTDSIVTGIGVTLTPSDPGEHSRQMTRLASKGAEAAASLTLCLGKLVLALRNYIEHGHDEVHANRLLIDGAHYWQEKGKFQEVLQNANAIGSPWRRAAELPVASDPVPDPANGLLLSPASLGRSLVLVSLVLYAGAYHLGVE